MKDKIKDARKKHRWFIPIPSESTYQVGGTTYIVSSQFAEPNQNSHTLRSRFERIIKNNSADLCNEAKDDIIQTEYVSTAHPIKKNSDRKENNAKENSSETK
ncbi:MAG: hypothetical protein E7678_03565 [Ruminococcaceae bacterium]|nr:hypothetical protein [Oscillospiraceae bacterium]